MERGSEGSSGRPPSKESDLVERPLGRRYQPRVSLAPPAVPRELPARWVDLEEIADSETFRLREPDPVAPLAEAIARDGQRQPVDLRETPAGLQLLSGHRRLAAVRLLRRHRILGRVHPPMTDPAALRLALQDDLDRRGWTREELGALRERLHAEGLSTPAVEALIGRAEAVLPEEPEAEDEVSDVEEVELETLADRIRDRLADGCNDLAALYEVWADLDEGRREELVECVRYLKDLYPLLTDDEP